MSLKEQVKRITPDTLLVRYAEHKLSWECKRNSKLPAERRPAVLCKWFEGITGEILDLDNPKTFNQKMQWLKLYDSTPEKGHLADKYLVRNYVAECIGENHLVPLLGVWDNPDEIDFETLPNRFVLKATHGCAWNIIVRDKAKLDINFAKTQLKKWLAMQYAFRPGFELHYSFCEPRVIAEQYIENEGGDLYDYKFFCFNGRCESVMFLKDRAIGLKMAFYDREWKKLPYVYSYPRIEEEIPKPPHFEEALAMAEKLAAGFPHVRVDFYISNDYVLFGEMTFTSMNGVCKWDPPEQDIALGKLLDLTQLPKWREMHDI